MLKYKYFIISIFLSCLPAGRVAQLHALTWTRTYGSGTGKSVRQAFDGGYAVAGYGDGDVRLIKTNANGDTLWTRHYGGTKDDYGYCVQQTQDSGYIITGSVVPLGQYDSDVWLIKTDANGDTLWTKLYGDTLGGNGGNSVQQTQDGGYIITGWISILDTTGYSERIEKGFYLVKTNLYGDTLWTRVYPVYGPGPEDSYSCGLSVQETFDKGYAAVSDKFGSYKCAADNAVWLIKTNSLGEHLWERTYDSGVYHGDPVCYSIQQTSDSGYIMVGQTDDPACKKDDMFDTYALLVIKTDSYGDTMWVRTYGGKYPEGENPCYSVQQTSDGCYILTGYKYNDWWQEVWLVKVAPEGDTLWSQILGEGIGYSVQQTSDTGYIIAGVRNDEVLLIKTNPQIVVLLAPNGGETLPGGTVQPINWFTEGTTFSSYNLLYSTDGGVNYDTLVVGISADTGAFSSYNWTLPVINCTTYRMKIEGLNAGDSIISEDVSSEDFAIRTYPTVIFPNGGEEWEAQATYPIVWSTFGSGNSFNLLYSAGGVWDTVAYSVSSPHPYPNNYDSTFIISYPGEHGLKIHFDTLDTEPGYDFLYVYDKYDTLIAEYSGVYGNLWTQEIVGDTAKIRLVSDGTTDGYGFDVDKLLIITGQFDTIATGISPDSTHWDWELPDIESNACYVKVQILDSLDNVVSEDESDMPFTITGIAVEESSRIQNVKLNIYPNPFRGKPVISYQLPVKSKVSLKIYDVMGRMVKTLVNEEKEAGNYTIKWDGMNNDKKKVSSGIYFCRFEAEDFNTGNKLILLER